MSGFAALSNPLQRAGNLAAGCHHSVPVPTSTGSFSQDLFQASWLTRRNPCPPDGVHFGSLPHQGSAFGFAVLPVVASPGQRIRYESKKNVRLFGGSNGPHRTPLLDFEQQHSPSHPKTPQNGAPCDSFVTFDQVLTHLHGIRPTGRFGFLPKPSGTVSAPPLSTSLALRLSPAKTVHSNIRARRRRRSRPTATAKSRS